MVYKGKQLPDNKTLAECGISPRQNVSMTLAAVNGIDIILKTRYGQALCIGDCRDDSVVKDLKQEIEESYGISVKNQIICNGKGDQNEVNVLDDQQCIGKLSTKTLDLVIVENVEIALKEKDKLLDEPYIFIKNANR